MKNPKFISVAIAAVIIVIITGWGCGTCPECPTSTTDKPCDTCYCLTPETEIHLGEDSFWCCTDTFSRPCFPDSGKYLCATSGADIRIDSLFIEVRPYGRVETDIYITNHGSNSASCAKLEILLPMASKFIEFIPLDPKTKNWQFYNGYLRVNLGQIETGWFVTDETDPLYRKSHRHVQFVSQACPTYTGNCGIAAFVYCSNVDPCLKNNYAYGYYQLDAPGFCTPLTKIIAPIVEP